MSSLTSAEEKHAVGHDLMKHLGPKNPETYSALGLTSPPKMPGKSANPSSKKADHALGSLKKSLGGRRRRRHLKKTKKHRR